LRDHPKVEVSTRLIAAVIDAVCSSVVGVIPIIGPLIGFAYMLIKDGLFEGQSLGKKVMKLQVVTSDGSQADFMVSVRRNAIFAVPILLMIIPVLGWVLAPIISLVIITIEVMKVVNEPKGRRLGDNWAASQVILFEEEGQPVPTPEPKKEEFPAE